MTPSTQLSFHPWNPTRDWSFQRELGTSNTQKPVSPIPDLTPGGDSSRPWKTGTKRANLVLLEMLPTSVSEMRISCGSCSQNAYVSSDTGLSMAASVHCSQYLLLPATCKDSTMECLGFRSTEGTLGQIFRASKLFKKWRGEGIKMERGS